MVETLTTFSPRLCLRTYRDIIPEDCVFGHVLAVNTKL